jgi:hypothetical protein
MVYGQFPTAYIAETDAILVRREAVWNRPCIQRFIDRGPSGRAASAIGARQDSATRSGRALTYGSNQSAEAATSDSAHRIGTSVP